MATALRHKRSHSEDSNSDEDAVARNHARPRLSSSPPRQADYPTPPCSFLAPSAVFQGKQNFVAPAVSPSLHSIVAASANNQGLFNIRSAHDVHDAPFSSLPSAARRASLTRARASRAPRQASTSHVRDAEVGTSDNGAAGTTDRERWQTSAAPHVANDPASEQSTDGRRPSLHTHSQGLASDLSRHLYQRRRSVGSGLPSPSTFLPQAQGSDESDGEWRSASEHNRDVSPPPASRRGSRYGFFADEIPPTAESRTVARGLTLAAIRARREGVAESGTIGLTSIGRLMKNSRRARNTEWTVEVTIHSVDLHKGQVSGIMKALNVPNSDPRVVTFFDGEIIDGVNYMLWADKQRWGATREVDREYWGKSSAFIKALDKEPWQEEAKAEGEAKAEEMEEEQPTWSRGRSTSASAWNWTLPYPPSTSSGSSNNRLTVMGDPIRSTDSRAFEAEEVSPAPVPAPFDLRDTDTPHPRLLEPRADTGEFSRSTDARRPASNPPSAYTELLRSIANPQAPRFDAPPHLRPIWADDVSDEARLQEAAHDFLGLSLPPLRFRTEQPQRTVTDDYVTEEALHDATTGSTASQSMNHFVDASVMSTPESLPSLVTISNPASPRHAIDIDLDYGHDIPAGGEAQHEGMWDLMPTPSPDLSQAYFDRETRSILSLTRARTWQDSSSCEPPLSRSMAPEPDSARASASAERGGERTSRTATVENSRTRAFLRGSGPITDEEMENMWEQGVKDEWVLMRWKERGFVNVEPHASGLTIQGFYYVALERSTGRIEGWYYDKGSAKYQRLTLGPASRGGHVPFARYDIA